MTYIDVYKKFPNVFKGLGNLGEEFTIKLKPNAIPQTIFTPRHVLLSLRPEVEEELNRMESLGVVSKVDQPTPWCLGIYGGRTKEKWQSSNMRRLKTPKRKCPPRSPSLAKS